MPFAVITALTETKWSVVLLAGLTVHGPNQREIRFLQRRTRFRLFFQCFEGAEEVFRHIRALRRLRLLEGGKDLIAE